MTPGGFVRRTIGLFVLLLIGGTATSSGSAKDLNKLSAKDLNKLSDILYTAFLAEQGSSMCNLPRLPLSDDDRTVFRNARNYAAWMKQ